MARSISPASPTPTARNCTPNAGAAAWITAYWPTPGAIPGSRGTAASFNRGHGDEVLACEGTGILPCIPKTQTSGNPKRGLFTVADFIYDAQKDRYTGPAGNHLTRGKVRSDRQDNIDRYRNLTACSTPARASPGALPTNTSA